MDNVFVTTTNRAVYIAYILYCILYMSVRSVKSFKHANISPSVNTKTYKTTTGNFDSYVHLSLSKYRLNCICIKPLDLYCINICKELCLA